MPSQLDDQEDNNIQKFDKVDNDKELGDSDIMSMRRDRGNDDEIFKPAQVIDYQNKPFRTSRWDDIDIITPAKVVDYGHKKPAVPIPPAMEDEYHKPTTSIDYGHASARKQMDPYNNRRDDGMGRRFERGYEPPPAKRWQDGRDQYNIRWPDNRNQRNLEGWQQNAFDDRKQQESKARENQFNLNNQNQNRFGRKSGRWDNNEGSWNKNEMKSDDASYNENDLPEDLEQVSNDGDDK